MLLKKIFIGNMVPSLYLIEHIAYTISTTSTVPELKPHFLRISTIIFAQEFDAVEYFQRNILIRLLCGCQYSRPQMGRPDPSQVL